MALFAARFVLLPQFGILGCRKRTVLLERLEEEKKGHFFYDHENSGLLGFIYGYGVTLVQQAAVSCMDSCAVIVWIPLDVDTP